MPLDFFAILDGLDIVCDGGRDIVIFGRVGASVAFAGDLADEIAENTKEASWRSSIDG